jgi:hypothetical protein
MSDHDIERIIRYHLSPINISFQTMNPELRCKMLNNRFAGDSPKKVDKLYEAGITMNGQIVLCKGVNDGEELEYSIQKMTEYLPYYTEQEHHRHDVRPGLTGWAQINGRNNIRSWEERFEYDLEYVRRCSLFFDIKILFMTVSKVLKSSDILVGSEIKVGRLDDARRKKGVESNTQEI